MLEDTFTIVWDMAPERLHREGCHDLEPDCPMSVRALRRELGIHEPLRPAFARGIRRVRHGG